MLHLSRYPICAPSFCSHTNLLQEQASLAYAPSLAPPLLQMRVLAETAQRTDSSAGDSDFSIAQRQPAADASARIAAAVAALAAAEPPLHALSHAAAKRLAARAIAPPPGKRTAPPTRVTAQHGGALLSGVDAAVAQAAEDAAAFLAHPAALAAAAAAQALLQAMSAPGVGGSAAQPSPQPNICCSCCSVSAPEACCSRTVAWTLPALAPPPPDDESWLVDGAAHAEQAGPSGQDHGSAHELSRTRLVALACVLVLAYGAEAGSGGEEPPAKRPARGWAEWGDGGGDGAASWSSGSESDLEPQRTGSAASELTARCPCCSGRGLPRGPLVSAGPCPARSPGGLCLGAVGALLLWVSDGGCFNPSNSREGLAEPIRAPCSHDATCRAPAALRCKARRFSLLEVAPPLAAAASAAHGGVLQRYIDTILHGRQAGSGGGGDAMVTTAVEERRPPLEGLSGATEAADRVRHLLVRSLPRHSANQCRGDFCGRC